MSSYLCITWFACRCAHCSVAIRRCQGRVGNVCVQMQDSTQPYGGESLLLMFDRWRKLERALYSKKDDTFDISKIPDVYDSIKYDCIHNKHLGLDFQEV